MKARKGFRDTPFMQGPSRIGYHGSRRNIDEFLMAHIPPPGTDPYAAEIRFADAIHPLQNAVIVRIMFPR
jgi:hypothetical protein